jgi:AraC-like DNA-binding protein
MKQVAMLRMRHAAVLLAHDAYSVEAVAGRVGYDNPYAFSTAFKRYMGVPPSRYRQHNYAQEQD